jgi:hypothetical protein
MYVRWTLVRRAAIPEEQRPVNIWVALGEETRPIDPEWMGVVRVDSDEGEPRFVLAFYRADGTWLTELSSRDTIDECLDEAATLLGRDREAWEATELPIPEGDTNDLPAGFAP